MVNNNTASAPFPGDDGKNTIDTTAVQSPSPGSAADVHTAPDSSPTRAMPTASDTQAMPTETMPQQEGKPQQAWQDQQDASAQYASEAYRNSYPGSGSIPPQGSGRPGPQYPGWDQYSGYPEHRRRRPRIYYKKGPYTMTVVWGIFLVLLGIIGIFSILRVTDFISQDYMAFLGIVRSAGTAGKLKMEQTSMVLKETPMIIPAAILMITVSRVMPTTRALHKDRGLCLEKLKARAALLLR